MRTLLLLAGLILGATVFVSQARAGACTQTRCTCNGQCSGTLICSAEGLCCGIAGAGRPCPADAGGDGGGKTDDDDGCSYGGSGLARGALPAAGLAAVSLALLRRRRHRTGRGDT
jgi:hypothetical protein